MIRGWRLVRQGQRVSANLGFWVPRAASGAPCFTSLCRLVSLFVKWESSTLSFLHWEQRETELGLHTNTTCFHDPALTYSTKDFGWLGRYKHEGLKIRL